MPRPLSYVPFRSSRRPRAGQATLAALLAGGVAAPAAAQVSDPEARATRGVHIAGAARAGDADPTAVQLNPAQLGLLPAGGLTIAADVWRGTTPLPGRGLGVYAATPLGSFGGVGFGLSRVGATNGLVEAHTTLQLGLALRLGRRAAFGVSWAHLWDSSFASADTFDFGLSARAGRYLALGLVLEDANAPRSRAGVQLQRLWAGELVVRPLGTERLELAVGAAHVEDDSWRRIAPRARLAGRLADGFRLFAVGQTLPRGGEYAFSSSADYRAEVGMALDLDHLGLTAAINGAIPAGDAGATDAGGAFLVRASGQQRPPVAWPATVVRVRLEHVDDDAAFLSLVRTLRALGQARDVAAVLLRFDDPGLGLGRLEELRDLVGELRAKGKRVYAYGAYPSTRDYYLAAACDAVILHPAGTLSLTGFTQTVTFYKRAMDTLGVNVDLVRIAEYKGAMEPFIMSEQSPPVRANKNEVLDDVFGRFVTAVARARTTASRTIDEARVRMLVDRGIFTPIEAQLVGLVDAVKDDDELEGWLAAQLGKRGISVREPDTSPRVADWAGRQVAVVMADGTIVDGRTRRLPFDLGDFAGSDSLVAALEHCRRSPWIGAVVLRVNSPGGSAYASDVVARAVAKLRKAGKPVVVSMGDVAASGGYYISAPADAIFVQPSTLTGSIGIFGYKVDVRKLMSTLGLDTDTYRRGQHADYLSPYRPWTDEEIKIAAEKIRHLYELFITTVAEGRRSRGLTRARVDEIGRGHVWTGGQAQALGLADKLGGVAAAIDHAARLANVPVSDDGFPPLTFLPKPSGGLVEQLLGLASVKKEEDVSLLVRSGLSRAGALSALRLLAPFLAGDGSGAEARLPYDLEIR